MTFRMIVQLWNTNTSAFVSCDADLTENYMYISMKFGTGVHVFCWEVGVFNRSSFQSVSYKQNIIYELSFNSITNTRMIEVQCLTGSVCETRMPPVATKSKLDILV